MRHKQFESRAMRNNNPLNIRIGNVWLGELENPSDKNYEQFCTIEYGLRAAFVLMRRYINHYHRYSVPEVVEAWYQEPPYNNADFIDKIYKLSSINDGETLNYFNQDQMCRLMAALSKLIADADIDMKKIEKAYKMA